MAQARGHSQDHVAGAFVLNAILMLLSFADHMNNLFFFLSFLSSWPFSLFLGVCIPAISYSSSLHNLSNVDGNFLKHFVLNVLFLPLWFTMNEINLTTLILQEITNALPFHRISLDSLEENDAIDHDLQGYILHRIHSSPEIQNNISLNGKMDNTTFGKLSGHLKALSQGSYLYLKLTFDLIEKGYLVLKSSSYKVGIDAHVMTKRTLVPNLFCHWLEKYLKLKFYLKEHAFYHTN